jgi:hypothetical protein
MSTALIGKYFPCVHDECWRSGIVEAAVNDDHYIVRFDALVRFNEGSPWPESLAVAAISNIVGNGGSRRAAALAVLRQPRAAREI